MKELFSPLIWLRGRFWSSARARRLLWLFGKAAGGFLLSRATVFESLTPFGIGWLAANRGGWGGFAAFFGTLLGTLTRGGTQNKTLAILILIYAADWIFRDVIKHPMFLPVAAGAITGFVGAVFVGDSTSFLFFAAEVMLVMGSGTFYRIAFDPAERGTRRTISTLFLVSTLLMSATGMTWVGGLSPARVAAGIFVLWIATRRGVGIGAAAGLCAGSAMDLSLGYPFFSMSYGLSGLLTGVFKNTGKFVCAVVYVVTGAITVLWSGTDTLRFSTLLETFCVSVLFMLLPNEPKGKRKFAVAEEESVDIPRNERISDRLRERTRRGLEQSSFAFADLHRGLETAAAALDKPQPPRDVVQEACTLYCRRCAIRGLCWTQEKDFTTAAFREINQILEQDGVISAKSFPPKLAGRCVKVREITEDANAAMRTLLSRRQYQSRLRESRRQICAQYAEISRVLSGLADEARQQIRYNTPAERRVYALLAPLVLDVSVLDEPRKAVEIVGVGASELLCDHNFSRKLEEAVGFSLGLPEQIQTPEGEQLIFAEAERFSASVGVASHHKQGETDNGDSGSFFKSAENTVTMILSDGMGSGASASANSREAVGLLERFLRAGVQPEAALATLNSALVLRGDLDTEDFVTVDLSIIDLMTGKLTFYKNGATPSYVCRNGNVCRVAAQSLPIGLNGNANPEKKSLCLGNGDRVLMMSDGICETTNDPWVTRILESCGSERPAVLARRILEQAVLHNGATDDMTVYCLQVYEQTTIK